MYAHHPSYNLEPRTLGEALARGIVGHAALETYYAAVKDGKTLEKAQAASMEYLMQETLKTMKLGDVKKSAVYSNLGTVLQNYFKEAEYILHEYNLLGVESLITAPLPGCDDIEFAGRVDLALGVKSGPNKGEVVPYDHKFTYNFWSENPLKLNPQINNYIWAFREKGHRSRTGIINMLRYRENAVDKFKQEPISTNSTLRSTFINNHVVAAKQIVELKHKPKVGLQEGITRSSSKFNCEYCPFATLCYTEALGQDTTLMVKASFRPNSYGYDSELDVA
jgi:hypothetical protein